MRWMPYWVKEFNEVVWSEVSMLLKLDCDEVR